MADASTDILMTVTGPSGQMRTDSRVAFSSLQGSGGLTNGFFEHFIFELKEFSFAVGAKSSLGGSEKEKKARELAEQAAKAQPGVAPLAAPAPIHTIGPAEAAREAGKNDTPDMQPIEFTRLMDSASTLLMAALVGCTTLPSVSIVKRKAAGTANGGEAYLRLDFTEVLLIGLDWKESSDVVEETGTFIYRKLKVSYRPQSQDGSLQPAVTANWAMKS